MSSCVQAFREAVPRQRGGAVIRSRFCLGDLLLVMVAAAAAAAATVVMVAMVMAVVVMVGAGLAVVGMMMMVVIMMLSSRGGPGEQRGRGRGGEDLDASGPRRADLMDVFQQLVQRRHVHHRLGQGLLGVVVKRNPPAASRRRCRRSLVIRQLPLLWEVQ